jgi:hypothetical protein
MIRQGQLIEQIAREVVDQVPGEWTSVSLEMRQLAPISEFSMPVTRPSGEIVQPAPAPRSSYPLLRELREVMYRPGSGTWFSAKLTISREGKVDAAFNYDDEPAWKVQPASIHYPQDLAKFPRDDGSIPEWLRSQLERAKVEYPEE